MYVNVIRLYQLAPTRDDSYGTLSLLPYHCYNCCLNLEAKLKISKLVLKSTNEDATEFLNFLSGHEFSSVATHWKAGLLGPEAGSAGPGGAHG